jgi:vitamin B12 transporter
MKWKPFHYNEERVCCSQGGAREHRWFFLFPVRFHYWSLMKKIVLLISLTFFNCIFAFADEEIILPEKVVTANRYVTPIEDTGRSIDVRTKDDFQRQEVYSVTDALQTVPGVHISNLGGPGSPGVTPIEIRGFRTGGTQLLLDGYRLNDPSSVSGIGESLFPFLTTNELSSVEVLKGSAGVNYGSDSQSGVVNLLTNDPTEGTHAKVSVRGGSFGTVESNGMINVGDDTAALRSTITRIDSDGLDAHGNYENLTSYTRGRIALGNELLFEPFFRLTNGRNDLDTSPTVDALGKLIPNLDTPSNHSDIQAMLFGGKLTYTPCEGIQSALKVYANSNDRDYVFLFDGFRSLSTYEGKAFNVDWQNVIDIPDLNSRFLVGTEFEHQTFESVSDSFEDSGKQDRIAFYAKDQLSFLEDTLIFNGGGRLSHVSAISRTIPTFDISGVYKVQPISGRVHSSFTSGYRAPTLFESKGNIVDFNTGLPVRVGNQNLEEEQATSFDVGYSQELPIGESVLDITYFSIDADQTIIYDFLNNTHRNGGSGQFNGIETSLTSKPLPWLLLRGAYTYIGNAKTGEQRLQRRPYNSAAGSATATLGKVTLFSELKYRGDQKVDFFGASNRYNESDVVTFDAAVTYKITPELDLFGRLDNLFDVDYTESGYRMPGISAQGGVRLSL